MNLDNSHITLYLTDLPTHILITISLLSSNFTLFLTCKHLYSRTLLTSFRVNYLGLKYNNLDELFSIQGLKHPWLNSFNTLERLLTYTGYDISVDKFKIIKIGLLIRKVNWFPKLLEKFEEYYITGGKGVSESRQLIINELLIEACKGRHIELIEMILLRGAQPSQNQSNLIFNSLLDNDYNLTKLLLTYAPSLDQIMINQLLKACSNIESIEIIDILLGRGGDINIENGYLIRQQCYLGNFRVVNYLLNRGADPTLMNHSTLLSACQRGHIQLIPLLVQHGCDPNFNNGMPIFFSVNYNRLGVIQELIKLGANPNLNNVGFTSLIICCKKGNLPLIKYFVETLNIPINPEHPDKERSPIIWAIINKHTEIVEFLINKGAELNNPNNCCLYYSKKSKQIKLSEFIESKGGILISE